MVEAAVKIGGHWYAARSSARHAAVLELDGGRYRIELVGESTASARSTEMGDGEASGIGASGVGTGDAGTLAFSDRLAATARRVTFPDGALFETRDNAGIDAWLAGASHAGARSLGVHRLESSWTMIAVSLVATVLIAFTAFRWGLPAASGAISDRLPVAAHESVGRGALATMDRLILDESELDERERVEIAARFDALVAAVPDEGFDLALHFRRMGDVPNAFALPGGDIVVTDALIELAEHPDELDGVLLHEIGHVHERHGMRHAISASTVTLVVSLALGDVGGLGELATAVPAFLLQSGYSRRSESEADEYAFARMLETGRDPKHFATIIRRLGETAPVGDGEELRVEPGRDWYSTHPDAEQRARRALEVSREGAIR